MFETFQILSSNLLGKIDGLKTRDERGSVTLEQVIWTAGIAVAAVAVVVAIVAAINAYAGQIPTG